MLSGEAATPPKKPSTLRPGARESEEMRPQADPPRVPNAQDEGPRGVSPAIGDLAAALKRHWSQAEAAPKVEEEGPHDAATRTGDLSAHATAQRSRPERGATQSRPASPGSERDDAGSATAEPPKAPTDLLRKQEDDGPQERQPRQISGRRVREPKPSPETRATATAERQFIPRPELICRQVGSSGPWEVVLRADEDCAIEDVRHDGESLARVNGEYVLASFRGTLSITAGGRAPYDLALFQGNPLIFKFQTTVEWSGDGRRVGGVTGGCFILIAPTEWMRLGSPPVAAEPCTDTGFTAHYYFIAKENPGHEPDGFDQQRIALTQAGFSLSGKRLFDDCDRGELFVGEAPKLSATEGVVWARVGEEDQDGWRGTNFKPAERPLADVLDGRQGRFFVRVFDAELNLLDSGEFRYLRDLSEIRVNDKPHTADTLLAPPANGHAPVVIHFVGVDRAMPAPGQVHAAGQPGGRVLVAPHPDGDVLNCALEAGVGRVDTTVNLGRVWWRITNGSNALDAWRGSPLALTREQFRTRAEADASIELRVPRHVSSVNAGFDDSLNRTYQARSRNQHAVVTIRLLDFVDYRDIDQPRYRDASFGVQCDGAALSLIKVSADPLPSVVYFDCEPHTVMAGEVVTLRWSTRNTEPGGVTIVPGIGRVPASDMVTITPASTTTFTLRLTASGSGDLSQSVVVTVRCRVEAAGWLVARVKRADGGWRDAKGFSVGELLAAGVNDREAARRAFSIDRRRRSTHARNVSALEREIDD